jgi:hypothetical protein
MKTIEALYEKKPPYAGFRMSLYDWLFVITTAIATIPLVAYAGAFGWLLPYVVGHFFLFCNVFRVRRRLELIWAAIFVCVFALCIYAGTNGVLPMMIRSAGSINPFPPMLAQMNVTIIFIILTLRHESYHGIAWKKFNPTLTGWGYQNGVPNSVEDFGPH